MMEDKDNWAYFRHKFILCMSEYLFNPNSDVNDPVEEFRLAKDLFVEVFGESIDATEKQTNNTINQYLKMAFLLYRKEITWSEEKGKLSIGLTRDKVNKLFTEKIDPENRLRNIYDTRIRPERYNKSLTQLHKEFDNRKISKEIMNLQITNPVLFDRLYRQITEYKFKQITDNIDFEKEIIKGDRLKNYLEEVSSPSERTDYSLMDYDEVYEKDEFGNEKQINYSEPDYDPKYFHQIYGIANPVIHDELSLKAMDYTDTQIDLKLFPYCFPRPHVNYPLEVHEEVSRLFYSLRQTMNGRIVMRDGSVDVPRTQLRASFNYEHHRQRFLFYVSELQESFPNYRYTTSMGDVNKADNCWATIMGKFYRIPIYENEAYDPDNWEMETLG